MLAPPPFLNAFVFFLSSLLALSSPMFSTACGLTPPPLLNVFVFFSFPVCLLSQVRCLAPPAGLRAYATSPNVFRVKWIDKYRNSKRSTQFTLRYRNIPGDDQYKYLNTTKGEVKRLNVITSNGSYEFSVKAVRGRKESEWSDPVQNSLGKLTWLSRVFLSLK